VSAVLVGLFGAFKGALTLRLRSDYLAVVTLALGFLVRQVFINLSDLTGGAGGISALPPPRILTYTLTHPMEHYYLVFGLIALLVLASQRLRESRLGRAWRAGSEDEIAAASSGVNLAYYKTLAFGLSSAAAGMAGAVSASLLGYIDPERMDFHLSAIVLAMVILGGTGSVSGVIVGALLIASYDKLVIPVLGEFVSRFQTGSLRYGSALDPRGLSYLSFGLALYLTVLLRARRRPEAESRSSANQISQQERRSP
jgi:branched-chain amino acid transport system permease protein